ncbi:hypothetical protein BX666DRAFT_1914622 [Dichotomocladium elegans]|nr:hypothetical protein BX666DRAFT_1914622 [Dichotomocladium elegans]
MRNFGAGLDAMSTQEPVNFDIEQVRAYATMSPKEFARSWRLQCVSSDSFFVESSVHEKKDPSSSDEDGDDIASVHTITCDSPPIVSQPIPLSDNEAFPQQQKSSRPPRQLRPRSTIQLQPFTIERAQYKALVRRADYAELLNAPRHPQRQRQSSSLSPLYRARSPSPMDEYNMIQGNDEEYQCDENDEMTASIDVQNDDEEEVMAQQLRQMKVAFPHIQNNSPSLARSPFGTKSFWPRTSSSSPFHTYSKKRKRVSAQERERRRQKQRRRPAPRIDEEEDDDDDANSLDSTLLAADPLQGRGIMPSRTSATTMRSEDRYDVFAFPSTPQSHTDMKERISSTTNSSHVLAFPEQEFPTALSVTPPSSRTSLLSTAYRSRTQKQKENDLDGFVVDDDYNPPSRKKNTSRDIAISTKGVLPYSFVRVGHRVTEPKRTVVEYFSDDENDRKLTSSESDDGEEKEGNKERRSSFSSMQHGKLSTFLDGRATPRRAVSLSPPPRNRRQVKRRCHDRLVAKAPPPSGRKKLSLSVMKKPLKDQSHDQQGQQTRRRPRRTRSNQQHGIYILPGPSSPEPHRYFTTTLRPRHRSPITFPSPDRDHIQVDNTLDSYWWPDLSGSPLASPSAPISGDDDMSAMTLDPQPLLLSEDESLVRFIESHQPFSVDFGVLPDARYRHGQFSATFYLNHDLSENGDYQVPIHVLGQELTLEKNGTVSHNMLKRLFYKCFRDLADHLEGRGDEEVHQDRQLCNMVTFFYFISNSLRIVPLPNYYEKEIQCFLSRVQMLIELKTSLADRQLPMVLIYAIDWLRHLPSPLPLNVEGTKTQLLKMLYRLGPDAAHVAMEEEEPPTGTVVVVAPSNAVVLEAWIVLLTESSCETVWQQIMEWLGHESIALHERVEKMWHWLFVLRVLLGFDKGGEWHGLGDAQRMAALPGVSKLLDDTQELCSRIGPLYDNYSECLSQRQDCLLGGSSYH